MTFTVNDFVHSAVLRHRDRVAVVDAYRSLTYRQIWDRASRLSGALMAHGVSKGDRVVVLTGNRAEWIEADLAISLAGAVRGRLNARDSVHEYGLVIQDLEPKAVIVAPAFEEPIAQVLAELGIASTCQLVVLGPSGVYERWIAETPPAKPVPVTADDLYCAIHTSGSSGRYKAAMYSHRAWLNIQRNVLACLIGGGVASTGTFLHAGPLSHQSGVPTWALFFAGFRAVIMDRFDPDRFFSIVERERPTHTIMVPTMINMIVGDPAAKRRDLTSFASVWYSGSPMAPDHLGAALEVFGPILLQGYGGTDSGCMYNTIFYPEDHVDALERRPERLASCGRPIPFFDIKLAKEDGAAAQPGEIGEIWVRGDAVSQGYWRRPELTSEAFTEGWFHTGDVASQDEDGFITILDRKNDMIVSGGMNVYPREVEDAIRKHPVVRDAVVVAAPHERWGEAVVACVVLVPGSTLSLNELQEHCRSVGLASYKKPLKLEVVSEMPLTAAGKPLRRQLRDRFWQGHARQVHG